MRNVGQLSGMLSQSYVPKLPEYSDTKVRKTYGNGKFKFPRNYEDDERDGVVGYDGGDSDDDSDGEGEGEGDEYHNVVSLIASEIYEQKKKEKNISIENENEKFRILQLQNEKDFDNEILLAEKEREDIQNNYIHEKMKLLEAVVLKEIEDEKNQELINERNEYNLRKKHNRNQYDMNDSEEESDIQLNNYDHNENDSDDNMGSRERGRERGREVDDQTPLHFWDSLLRKPLSPQETDSREGSRIPAEHPIDLKYSDGNFLSFILFTLPNIDKVYFFTLFPIFF